MPDGQPAAPSIAGLGEFHSGEEGIRLLLRRASGLDAQAVACARQFDAAIEVFVTTPFEVVAMRRAQGSCDEGGAVLASAALRGVATPAMWPEALPPKRGFQLIDEVPAGEVLRLAQQGRVLARQFSRALGPPASLLRQEVVSVSNGPRTVGLTMRQIFALSSLGLLPSHDAPSSIPRHLRVSDCGRWLRIDAPFGSIYQASRLNLLVM